MDAMRDHLTDLQCDQKYLRQHIKTLFGSSMFKAVGEETSAYLLALGIYEDVLSYYSWRWIESECRHVQELHIRFRDSTFQGSPIPSKYNKALGALELLLVNQVISRTQYMNGWLPFTPGLSKYWTLYNGPDAPQVTTVVTRNSIKTTKEASRDDPLD